MPNSHIRIRSRVDRLQILIINTFLDKLTIPKIDVRQERAWNRAVASNETRMQLVEKIHHY